MTVYNEIFIWLILVIVIVTYKLTPVIFSLTVTKTESKNNDFR